MIKQVIEEAEEELEEFDHIKTNEFMDVYMRLGSKYHDKCPYSKVFYKFDCRRYTADDLLFILSNLDLRPSWDTNICESSLLKKVSGVLSLIHIGVKAPFPYTNRDFVQKRIHFKDGDAYYSYFTSTKDEVK